MSNNSQPLSYKNRLSDHIDKYLTTVLEAPQVRINEFLELKRFANLIEPKKILEVSAEIGMLEQVYPNIKIDRADWLKIRLPEYADVISVTDFSLTGIQCDCYDAILGIVPIHHANHQEKLSFIKGSLRALKVGGVLCFGEVEQGSEVHAFLDEFVHHNTETGHIGAYVNSDLAALITQLEFAEVNTDYVNCPWVFESIESMIDFITALFNLKAISQSSLVNQLDRYLGIQEENGRYTLGWGLRYFRGVKSS